MKKITVVTGPMRSGTSCITGLLERCGFDLGRNVRVVREHCEHNPKGDLEPDLLIAINARLIIEAYKGGRNTIPEEQALAELAAKRERYFQLFIRKFDGDLFKEPMMCLTLPLWNQRWPDLQQVIFCLRHPLEVARSIEKFWGMPEERGLELWQIFTSRFFNCTKRFRVFVLDFNAFSKTPLDIFVPLLDWLGWPKRREDIQRHLDEFFSSKHLHWSFNDTDLRDVPPHVRELYLKIRSYAGPWS